MRHSILPMILVIVLIGSWAIAGGKGRSGGGGQGHGARAHGSSTQPSHASRPQSATATSSLPLRMYSSMLPMGSNPGLGLYHGYHASRNSYGNGRGNRGYGHRNSMVNNRMMRLSRLVRDLNTLTVGYAASPNDRNILRNDLMGVAQGGIRPPSAGGATTLRRPDQPPSHASDAIHEYGTASPRSGSRHERQPLAAGKSESGDHLRPVDPPLLGCSPGGYSGAGR